MFSRTMMAKLGVTATVLALALSSAHAVDRRAQNVDLNIRLAGANVALGYGTGGFYTWRAPYQGRFGRFRGQRGVQTDIRVTRGGFVEIVYFSRGRIIDIDTIGRVDRFGQWNLYRNYRGGRWDPWYSNYYRGWDRHYRGIYGRQWDLYDRFDERRYRRNIQRNAQRNAQRDARRWDQRDLRQEQRFDRREDRRFDREDRQQRRGERQNNRQDDRSARRDDRGGNRRTWQSGGQAPQQQTAPPTEQRRRFREEGRAVSKGRGPVRGRIVREEDR